MNPLDVVFISISGVGLLSGFMKGAVREFFSLFGNIIAFIVAFKFYHTLSTKFALSGIVWVDRLFAFGVIYILISVSFGLLGKTLRRLVVISGLSFFDRIAGAVLGLVKGVVIVVVLFVILTTVYPPIEKRFRSAQTYPIIKAFSVRVMNFIGRKNNDILFKKTSSIRIFLPQRSC